MYLAYSSFICEKNILFSGNKPTDRGLRALLPNIVSLHLQARKTANLQIQHRRQARDTTPDMGDTQTPLPTTAQRKRRTKGHGILHNYQDTAEGVKSGKNILIFQSWN